MSKILKVILVSIYSAFLIHYLNITFSEKSEGSIELTYVFRNPGALKKIHRNIVKYGRNATLRKMTLNFKRPERLSTDLKYILKWTEAFAHFTSTDFPNGQEAFIKNKCEFINCFIATDKNLIPDMRLFDAVLFDVENTWDRYPMLRSPHQYYIFIASESACNYPICDHYYDRCYNLTWTYKLDSDIRWSYITVLDNLGEVVAPKVNMTWKETDEPPPHNVLRRLVHKKKVAAWFVSNCKTKSKREKVATNISAELEKYNLKIDIYGWCGELTCPKERFNECLDLVEQDYYFYLSFENSLGKDFVTEKLVHALQHYAVPIVYGGADYSRFLPPGSYLNAGELSATEIAFRMNEAMKKPSVYQDFFRWHNHYSYKDSRVSDGVCKLCEMLNDPSLGQRVLNNFRQWWNEDFKKDCAIEEKRARFKRKP